MKLARLPAPPRILRPPALLDPDRRRCDAWPRHRAQRDREHAHQRSETADDDEDQERARVVRRQRRDGGQLLHVGSEFRRHGDDREGDEVGRAAAGVAQGRHDPGEQEWAAGGSATRTPRRTRIATRPIRPYATSDSTTPHRRIGTPASAGPAMRGTFIAIDCSATALGRSSGGAALPTSARARGLRGRVRRRSRRPSSAGTSARPSGTRVAVTALIATMAHCAETRSAADRTCLRARSREARSVTSAAACRSRAG